MHEENIWQQTIDLTDRLFRVSSGLDFPTGNYWPTLVIVSLRQANEILDSIRAVLAKNYWNSAVILTRSLFELTVNLAYIAKNPAKRLQDYLKHGGIPLTSEEAKHLEHKLVQGVYPQEVKDVVPGQTWRRLKVMCCDLGSDWLKEYETFYRYSSVPTHAGAFTLCKNYNQLLKQELPSAREKALVLITATAFHLRLAEIAAKVFPEQIDLKKIQKLQTECHELGQQLPRLQKKKGNS